jgi:hypothetical protein
MPAAGAASGAAERLPGAASHVGGSARVHAQVIPTAIAPKLGKLRLVSERLIDLAHGVVEGASS